MLTWSEVWLCYEGDKKLRLFYCDLGPSRLKALFRNGF